jgi:hypothetical protein
MKNSKRRNENFVCVSLFVEHDEILACWPLSFKLQLISDPYMYVCKCLKQNILPRPTLLDHMDPFKYDENHDYLCEKLEQQDFK